MLLKIIKPSRFKIVAAGLMDGAIPIAVTLILFYIDPYLLPTIITDYPNISIFIGFILYRFIALYFLDGTLGMKIFKIMLLNGNGEPLSLLEIILASLFILFRGVAYYSINPRR